jgi:hypothetical protein
MEAHEHVDSSALAVTAANPTTSIQAVRTILTYHDIADKRTKQSSKGRRGRRQSSQVKSDSFDSRSKPAHQARARPRPSFYSTTTPTLTPYDGASPNYIRRVSSLPGTESSVSARKRQGVNSPRLHESLVPLVAWSPGSWTRDEEGERRQALERVRVRPQEARAPAFLWLARSTCVVGAPAQASQAPVVPTYLPKPDDV